MSEEERVALYWPKRVTQSLNELNLHGDKRVLKKKQLIQVSALEGGCTLYRAFTGSEDT
jgi:hypothetical protein